MHRTTPKSVTALLLAILFLLITAGDGFGVSPCSHHETSAPAQHAPESDSHHGHHGPDSTTLPDSHDHDAAPCTCIGGCLPGIAGQLPPPAVRVGFAPAEIRDAAPPAPATEHPRTRLLPHVLPFAQAPPAA